MKTHVTLALLLGLALSAQAQEKIVFDIHFNTGEATLDPADKSMIESAFDLNAPDELYSVKITGHTDTEGAAGENQALSERRATAVLDYIKTSGFEGTDITTSGVGESQLLSSETESTGKAENRRVEVVIERSLLEGNDRSLFNGMNSELATEELRNSQGGQLTYGSGTVITIPENAFVDANGMPVDGKVEVAYREFRDPVDIMFSNIPMTHNENGTDYYMQSGGMFEIFAYQNGQQLSLGEGKRVQVDFATIPGAEDYDFWKADEDGHWSNANNMLLINDEPVGRKRDSMIVDFNGYRRQWLDGTLYLDDNPDLLAALTIHTAAQARAQDKHFTIGATKKQLKLGEFDGAYAKDTTGFKGKSKYFNIAAEIKKDPTSMRHVHVKFTDQNGDNFDLEPFKDSWFKLRKDDLVKSMMESDHPALMDLRVLYDGQRNKFWLYLKNEEGEHRYVARRIPEQGVGANQAKERNSRLYKEYKTALRARHKMLRHEMTMAANQKETPAMLDSRIFWEGSKPWMTTLEKRMTYREWMRYYAENPKIMEPRYQKLEGEYADLMNELLPETLGNTEIKRVVYGDDPLLASIGVDSIPRPDLTIDFRERPKYDEAMAVLQWVIDSIPAGRAKAWLNSRYAFAMLAMNPELIRSVSIDGMGQWNCDALGRFEEPQKILASYQDENGQPVSASFLSTLFVKENSALSQDPYSFSIDQRSDIHLVVIDRSGNYWVLKDNDRKNTPADDNGNYLYTMTDVTNEVNGPSDLKRILGIGS